MKHDVGSSHPHKSYYASTIDARPRRREDQQNTSWEMCYQSSFTIMMLLCGNDCYKMLFATVKIKLTNLPAKPIFEVNLVRPFKKVFQISYDTNSEIKIAVYYI